MKGKNTMKIKLGKTIRDLRKRDNRTQEDVAGALGITSQAVSRWESEGAYPDMELIPSLANYFGVTLDELFGFESKKEKAIDDILAKIETEAQRACSDNEWVDDGILQLREGLAQFPGDERLLMKLADLLWRAGYCHRVYKAIMDDEGYFHHDMMDDNQDPYGAESIRICENLAETAKDKEIVYAANHLLICLYRDRGAVDSAIACAERMPYMYRCRELTLCDACDGKKAAKYTGEALLTMAGNFANRTLNALTRNAFDFNSDWCLEKIRGVIALFDLLCEDGNYGEYYGNLIELHLVLSYVQWLRGYGDDAFVSLDRAYEYAKTYESLCDGTERHYTAMLLKNVKYLIPEMPGELRAEVLPMRWPVWGPGYEEIETIKSDPRFIAWAEKCKMK